MRVFKLFCVSILSLVFLQACNDDNNNHTEETVLPNTIVDVAINNGNFTTLVAALQATGLDTALSNPDAKFTVFAPTDSAFALLGEETINNLLADTDTLTNILSYHVIDGEVNASTAISLAGTTVGMLNGDLIGLSLDGENLLVNTATVITTDILTDNGIIHVIDAVLLPPATSDAPSMNIVETAVDNGNFTTLVAALQATDLDMVLADENKSFTVFAPTDTAFALIGEDTIGELLNNLDILTAILLQHVVDGAVNSVNAYTLNGQMVTTASGADIPLQINQSTDMLTFGGANIIIKDIETTNGIIHVIDAVIIADVALPTSTMNLVDAAMAYGNLNTLASALQATGLDTTLADIDNNYTVFAPTDNAFSKLPEGTIASLSNDQLTDILLYHVLAGKNLSDGAIAIAQSDQNQVTMANNGKASLSFANSMLFLNGAKIETTDVIAKNGVIHIIDSVILPPEAMTEPTQNIAEIALADPDNFSTLVTALSAADLVSTLSDNSQTFTVFAPTNAAFSAIDPDALSALLADNAALTNVLLTHVISDVAINSVDAYAANGKLIETASGTQIAVGINSDTGMLTIGGANVIIKDIYATNGIIHVIDTVILE